MEIVLKLSDIIMNITIAGAKAKTEYYTNVCLYTKVKYQPLDMIKTKNITAIPLWRAQD